MNAPPKPAPLSESDLARIRSGQDPSPAAYLAWAQWYAYFVQQRRAALLFNNPRGNSCDNELRHLQKKMRANVDHTEIAWRLALLQRCIDARGGS